MPARKQSTTDPIAADIERLMRGEHADPHHVLGVHKADGKVVVRALRPDAVAMRVLTEDGKVVDMRRRHEGGLFEAQVPEDAADSYRLEAHYAGGDAFTFEDAYRFWPTLGELDLHL